MFGTRDLALFAQTLPVVIAAPGVDSAFTLASTSDGGMHGGLATGTMFAMLAARSAIAASP